MRTIRSSNKSMDYYNLRLNEIKIELSWVDGYVYLLKVANCKRVETQNYCFTSIWIDAYTCCWLAIGFNSNGKLTIINLFFFISNFNSNFISSPFLLSSVSSRSHRYAYNYYETGRSMFDKIRCRLESNRIFRSDHLSSSSHEIGLTSWPSAFPIG